jgi:hypothetical protein
MADIAKRFERETTQHEMTVAHDHGLYRHLKFRRTYWRPPLLKQQRSSFYWFDLITVPGALIFQGDGETFAFRRVEDMFEFFRMSAWDGQPNITYWAEKVTTDRDSLQQYSGELFVRVMREHYVELIRDRGVPAGTSKALLAFAEDYDLSYEVNAHAFLDEFQYQGFQFEDTWDLYSSFRDYGWWFLWSLHAIVWGIGQYDAHRVKAVA